MDEDQERVVDCTTPNFTGVISVMDPTRSWAARWLRIVLKLSSMENSVTNIISFSKVCKSWKSVTLKLNSEEKPILLRLIEEEKSWLPPKYPWLLLAEPTATMPFKRDDDHKDEAEEEDEEKYSGDDDDHDEWVQGHDNEEEDNYDDFEHYEVDNVEYEENNYDPKSNSIGSIRGLFSLSTRKTYVFSLPEAADKLIAGTNIGWLVTLGRDLQINLLHPLLSRQIPLPPMDKFTTQEDYDEDYPAERATEFFIQKVVLSSRISTLPNLLDVSPRPIVMTIYGHQSKLGFAKLGDKTWTDVYGPFGNFYDIVYHKQKFYGVDRKGDIYECDIDHGREVVAIGNYISSLPATHHEENHKYLVESLCGSYLYLVVRVRKYDQGIYKYLTTKFSVWKFQVDCGACKWAKVRSLKNKALFVGRMQSLCVGRTGPLKPNCIYYTDDYMEGYLRERGGYDMGIYNLETGTIKPHFQGISIHPISPPLWYI